MALHKRDSLTIPCWRRQEISSVCRPNILWRSIHNSDLIVGARNNSWPLAIIKPISAFGQKQNSFWLAKFPVHFQWDSNQ